MSGESTTQIAFPQRYAVFASGRGSNLKALLDARKAGRLPLADLRLVVCNEPGAGALALAEAAGVACAAIDHRPFKGDRIAHESAILDELKKHHIDGIVLAGYMRILTPRLLRPYAGRIINIHPSLLPSFPGTHAQRQALAAGVKLSGCTVHFVDEGVDTGPIILQRAVPVFAHDSEETLSRRILEEEHKALPLALDLLSRHRLKAERGIVRITSGPGSFPELESELSPRLSILLATGNKHKVGEISAILGHLPVVFDTTDRFPGMTEPEESADDYLGNARIKARVWQVRSGMWTLADDSGLEVEALGGRPGVKSARYAPTAEERIRKLLGELHGVPAERRRAKFVCEAVLAGPDGAEHRARGECHGSIALESRGDRGFGYDPVFIPDGYGGKHLAELPESVKNGISHRARAMQQLESAIAALAK